MYIRIRVEVMLISLLIICLTAIGVMYGIAVQHRYRARSFLKEFADLQLGQSTFSDAQHLAEKYRGIPWYVSQLDMRCRQELCTFAFQFDNLPVGHIPFVGYTKLLAQVMVKSGLVTERMIDYERLASAGHFFQYNLLDSTSPAETGGQYGVFRLKVDSNGIPHALLTRLGPQSSEDLRRRAYSFDTSCLARIYDCGNPSSFYPPGISYIGSPYGGLMTNEK